MAIEMYQLVLEQTTSGNTNFAWEVIYCDQSGPYPIRRLRDNGQLIDIGELNLELHPQTLEMIGKVTVDVPTLRILNLHAIQMSDISARVIQRAEQTIVVDYRYTSLVIAKELKVMDNASLYDLRPLNHFIFSPAALIQFVSARQREHRFNHPRSPKLA